MLCQSFRKRQNDYTPSHEEKWTHGIGSINFCSPWMKCKSDCKSCDSSLGNVEWLGPFLIKTTNFSTWPQHKSWLSRKFWHINIRQLIYCCLFCQNVEQSVLCGQYFFCNGFFAGIQVIQNRLRRHNFPQKVSNQITPHQRQKQRWILLFKRASFLKNTSSFSFFSSPLLWSLGSGKDLR